MMRRSRAIANTTGLSRPLARNNIHLKALLQMLAVAEYLSFSQAANVLGVSQSSVSTRIRALEMELGILLFERNTRGVRLTEAGRLFVEQVASSIDQLDYAVKTAGMEARGDCSRLRIGVHGIFPGNFLDKLLAIYRARYPEIFVEIVEEPTRDIIKYLRAHNIDLAFLVGTFNLPDFHSRPIWTEELIAAVPAHHFLAEQSKLTWSDLANETFLVRQGGTGPQVLEHILHSLVGNWPPPTIQRVQVERCTLLSMVAQGFGITLMGAAIKMYPTIGVTFLSIEDEPKPIVFSAVWSPKYRSTACRNLLSLADEVGRSLPIN